MSPSDRVVLFSTDTPPSKKIAAPPSLALHEFPDLFSAHWDADPSTKSVELYARDFVAGDLPKERIWGFVRMVCGWGGSAHVAQKIVTGNAGQTAKLRNAFVTSLSDLSAGRVQCAIKGMDAVPGLGISYASKHLKFLDPERAVVLDKRISDGLGYKLTPAGYLEFVTRCTCIATKLNGAGVRCSSTATRRWRVSDVEMAIFRHVLQTASKPKQKS